MSETTVETKTFTIYSRFDSSIVVLERQGSTLREVVIAAVGDRANLSGANLSGANLSRADLSGADLSGADLSRANLSRADLSGANLSGANLSRADLSRANLSRADLSGANLSRADLSGADLSRANLSTIKQDIWDVLLRAPNEIAGLLAALREGRVNGSAYEGECACLVGTIANVAHKAYCDLELIKPNGSRPAERWFLAIRKGDTPETSNVSKITVEWVEEFEMLLARAIELRTSPTPAA